MDSVEQRWASSDQTIVESIWRHWTKLQIHVAFSMFAISVLQLLTTFGLLGAVLLEKYQAADLISRMLIDQNSADPISSSSTGIHWSKGKS